MRISSTASSGVNTRYGNPTARSSSTESTVVIVSGTTRPLHDGDHGTGALIADVNTSWAYRAFTGVDRSPHSAIAYDGYVECARGCAKRLACRPDDVERALFEPGKSGWPRPVRTTACAL